MSEPRRNEKEEEKREKEDEKRSEKTWDEKWRHNPVRVITLAIILIWAGVIAFLADHGVLGEDQTWGALPAGHRRNTAGQSRFPDARGHQASVGGTIIIGVILVAIGLGGLINCLCLAGDLDHCRRDNTACDIFPPKQMRIRTCPGSGS